MKKNRLILSLFLGLVISFTGQGAPVIDKDKIYDHIELLKYSESPREKQLAQNYLFDNFEQSRKYIYQELLNTENLDAPLANLFFILFNAEEKLDVQIIQKSARIHLDKQNYMYYLFSYYLLDNQKDFSKELLYEMLKPGESLEDLSRNMTALKIIRFKKLGDYKAALMTKLLGEESFLLQEEVLKTLASLSLEDEEIKRVVLYLGSLDEGVRGAAVSVVAQYPTLLPYLKEVFEESDDFFEKLSIIESIMSFSELGADFFLISLLEEDVYQDKILEAFLTRKSQNVKVVERLIGIYQDQDKVDLRQTIIRLLTYTFATLEEPGRKKILDFMRALLRKEKELDDRILYEVYSGIFHIRYMEPKLREFLSQSERKKTSWRVKKMIRQILDLNKQN